MKKKESDKRGAGVVLWLVSQKKMAACKGVGFGWA